MRGGRFPHSRSRVRCMVSMVVLATVVIVYAIADSIPANAQVPAGEQGGLHFQLHTARHRSIDKLFRQRIEQHIQRLFQALLQDDMGCLQSTNPDLEAWLDDHALDQLTPELCHQLGIDRVEKTLILSLAYSRGTYELAALEYDRRFHSVSAPRRRRTVQREMVRDHIGQLAVRSWSPVGTIVDRNGENFVVSFPNQGAIFRLRDFSQLTRTGSLQPYRELPQGNVIRQDRNKDVFLLIDRVEPHGITTQLASSHATTNWFQFLGRGKTRYLTRLVQPRKGAATVRVVEQGTRQPREGCLVYVSDQKSVPPEKLGKRQGTTDATGKALFHSEGAELNYVTVVYGNIYLSRVYVHGVSQIPLLFQLPIRGTRIELEQTLTRLEDTIDAAQTVLNDTAKKMEDAAGSVDVSRVTKLVEEIQRFVDEEFDINRIKSEIESVRDAARKDRYQDLIRRAERTLQIAGHVERDMDLSKFEEAKRSVIVKDLRMRINRAEKSYDWKAMEQHLGALVKTDPNDGKAKRLLTELVKRRKVQNPEHVAARGVVERAAEITTIDTLLTHWSDLNEASTVLIQNHDALKLVEIRNQFKAWNILAANEAKRIEKTAQSSNQLSVQEIKDIRERSEQIQKLSRELLEIRRRSAEIIQKLFQP